ncbi:MAG TPA: Holliday junction branch migration protein RuvA [Micromonosporaceae bacterium]|jgi:Holliday junction DNA helicase RuvA|nr:Holliday junction branch migration protein RuvA [Micromonosporaceae bacterium]
MIASVRGRITALGPDHAVVEVAGIGFAVQCAPGTLARLRVGQDANLATSLVVREDSLTLYGFPDSEERTLFELLQTASGVGPRLAQAMLAVHSPDVLRRAVSTGDIPVLTRVPGIGKKGAERLVLELRDRIGAVESVPSDDPLARFGMPWREQLQQALIGLGWSASQAAAATEQVAGSVSNGASPDIAALLKRAIRLLGRSP